MDKFDESVISPENLKITQNRWNSIMEMLLEEGYVKGACKVHTFGMSGIRLDSDFGITLKGLEYLNDNSFMKKAAGNAKGISEMLP